jgi:hypothetical protein
MNKSDYLAAAVLDAWLRGVSPTLPTSLYVALYLDTPTSAGGGTEVSGGSYLRALIKFNAPASGMASNSNNVRFPTPTAAWGNNVPGVAIFDAISGGNMLYFGLLSSPRAIDLGDSVFFPAGFFTVDES